MSQAITKCKAFPYSQVFTIYNILPTHYKIMLLQIVAGGGGTGADSHGGFLSWLNLNYVKKDDMDIKLAELKTVINKRMDKIITHQDTSKVFAPSWRSKSVTEEVIVMLVKILYTLVFEGL